MNPAVLPRTDIRVRYPPSYVIEIFGGMAATQMYHNILQQCVSLSVCESQYRIETTETRHQALTLAQELYFPRTRNRYLQIYRKVAIS